MMTGKPKIHLRGRTWRHKRRAACGLTEPKAHTADPNSVTCAACARTLFMADVEVTRQRNRGKTVQPG